MLVVEEELVGLVVEGVEDLDHGAVHEHEIIALQRLIQLLKYKRKKKEKNGVTE